MPNFSNLNRHCWCFPPLAFVSYPIPFNRISTATTMTSANNQWDAHHPAGSLSSPQRSSSIMQTYRETHCSQKDYSPHIVNFSWDTIGHTQHGHKPPMEKIPPYAGHLDHFLSEMVVSLHELWSVIGKLNFATSVIRPSSVFIRCLIDLTRRVTKLYYKISLCNSLGYTVPPVRVSVDVVTHEDMKGLNPLRLIHQMELLSWQEMREASTCGGKIKDGKGSLPQVAIKLDYSGFR